MVMEFAKTQCAWGEDYSVLLTTFDDPELVNSIHGFCSLNTDVRQWCRDHPVRVVENWSQCELHVSEQTAALFKLRWG